VADTLSAVISGPHTRRDQPALHVGLAADAPATPPVRIGLGDIARVEIGRSDARRIERIDAADAVQLGLADARLSQRHALLTRSGTSWLFEDLESKNGSWVRGRRITRRVLLDGDVIIVGHTALIFRSNGGETANVGAAPASVAAGLQTMSSVLEARFAELAVASRSMVPIEVTGETGTGKELVARGIHALSERRGEFVALNCGAITSSLFEAELFGHRKGAYTGASDERVGLIRSADRGTLFLDEIAELPPLSQVALLRVLQECEVTPVGADRPVKVDLRVVTATHQSLDDAVAAGRFRADLRARLLGFQIELPALRDRTEDLALMIAELLRRIGGVRPLGFSIDAVGALYAYDWPLNIRELERALAAAAVVARDRIELAQLPASLQTALLGPHVVDETTLPPADLELRRRLVAAIARHGGNLADVARELGKDRTQIRRWMKRLGVTRDG